MFDRLTDVLHNIINLSENEITVSVFHVPEVKQFIVRLNRVEQLYEQGLDANDKIIGTYSYTTASEAGENTYIFNGIVSHKNYGEPYTLFDSGEFYESFRVIVGTDGFVITANTAKPDGDLTQFGEILGITPESKDELSEKMVPFLRESLREEMLK